MLRFVRALLHLSTERTGSLNNLMIRREAGRQIICVAIVINLLMWPGADVIASQMSILGSSVLRGVAAPLQQIDHLIKRLLRARPQRETLAERLAYVNSISISPEKFVAYQGDTIPFTARARHSSGEMLQGVRFTWESSDPKLLEIDDTGEGRAIAPGLVQVICRAGTSEARVPVYVRPGTRRSQSNAQWDADQSSLSVDGSVSGSTTGFLEKLANALTVNAQGGCFGALGDSTDFGYDELWSEPRNQVGHPRNRPVEGMRIGSVLPEQNNFNFSIPIYGLPGRGVGGGVSMNYNSRVWSRHGSAVTFNAVNGWPFAGFSLGFGRIFTYGSGSNTKYVLIDADGTRRYLGTGSDTTSGTYQTSDGSHITFIGSKTSGGSLRFNDGTKVSVTNFNNVLLFTRIKDPNGNFVDITYKTYGGVNFPWRQAISYIMDTLGRVIQFNYDSNGHFISIDVPGFGGTAGNPVTQTIARFDYQSIAITNSFSGLTAENLPSGNVCALKHVFFPATQTGYLLTYSAYGVVYNVSLRRQMSYDSQSGAISDGVQNASVSFNYPVGAAGLTDAPSFTQRTESPGGTYSYSITTDTIAQTKTVTITRPDTSQLLLTRSTNSSSVTDDLLIRSEIKNGSGAVLAKTELAYVNDPGGSPQVQSIMSYDDAGDPVKTDFDYDQYGNVTNKRDYGHQISGAWQVRRRARFVYKTDTAYINAYLRSLVTEQNLYDAQQNTNDADDVMIAKSTYVYDDYAAMGGMEGYSGQPEAPNHDLAFNTSFTMRGNVTGVTQFKDVAAGQSFTRLSKLDKYGNVVKVQLDCCVERTFVTDQTNGFSAPLETTSGSGSTTLTSSSEHDFNTSLVKSATDPRDQTVSMTYDSAKRPAQVTLPTSATQTASYNDSALTSSSTVNFTENGNNKSATTTTTYDGWGRTASQVSPSGGQINTSYDSMGRVQSVTNPFQSGQAPGPSTSYSCDALGRTTTVTLPDSQTVQTVYSGHSVTQIDQVGRQIKREADGLGRLVKVVEQDAGGALTQETTYTYDLMDNLIEVNQGGQLRKFKYDSLGRLLFERIPEQSATINDGTGVMWSCKYTYNDFNQVATKTDARGVITTYGYDTMNRLTSVSYNTSWAPGVAATPSVTYNYDTNSSSATVGLLLSVTVGTQSAESYAYDGSKRLASTTRMIGTRTYTTSYQYNTAGQLTQLTYPSGRVVNVNHDSIGRLSSIVNTADGANYLSAIGYNPAGQVTGRTLGSNIVEAFGYSSTRLQLTSQTATQNGFTRMSLSYNYQASAGQMGTGTTAGNAGQLMSVTGTINGLTESAAYTYDLYGRLVTSSQTTNGAAAQRRFEYDRWGNRTGVWNATSGGTQIQAVALQQSGGAPTNQIQSVNGVNYSYDAAGNVTNDGVHSYAYDAENRLVSVDGEATATYIYDHQNRRLRKPGIHYVWEGYQAISEHNASNGSVLVDYIYDGSQMVAKEDSSGGRQFFLHDRLSIKATITDGQGSIQGTQSHLPFGEQLTASGSQDKHRLTNYEQDSETGNDYAVNRTYSSPLGRFLSPDPYRPSGYVVDSRSWNRYSYVRNDTVNRVDPLGLQDVDWFVIPRHYVVVVRPASSVGGITGGREDPGLDLPNDEDGGGGQFTGLLDELPDNQEDAVFSAFNALIEYLTANITEGCDEAVIKKLTDAGIDFSTDSFRAYLSQGMSVYNGLTSTVLVAGNVMPRRPANLAFGEGATVAGVFQSRPGVNAMTSITASALTIFIRPGTDANGNPVIDLANGGNNSRNLGLLFHEALHGFTRRVDQDLQNILGLSSGASSNITQYITENCFPD